MVFPLCLCRVLRVNGVVESIGDTSKTVLGIVSSAEEHPPPNILIPKLFEDSSTTKWERWVFLGLFQKYLIIPAQCLLLRDPDPLTKATFACLCPPMCAYALLAAESTQLCSEFINSLLT